MAVKLRLTRRGKTKQPFYRIVVTDSRTARDGKYIDKIGHYNPLIKPAEIILDEEKAFYWLKNGAIPTNTVQNLLSKKGLMLKWSLMKKGADAQTIDEEFKKWELLQIERQKRLEAIEAQAKREQAQKKSEIEAKDKEEEIKEPAAEAEVSTESPEPVAELASQEPAASEVVVEAKVEGTAETKDGQ